MNILLGTLMLALSGGLIIKYRPRAQSSRILCAMTAGMGLMALGVGTGGWVFQLLQLALHSVVAACTLLQLRRELAVRRRRAQRRSAPHCRQTSRPRAKNCA